MKSFVAKSTLTEASNSTSIDEVNEIRRAQNVKISASLPSTETRQIQHRLTVPIESNISTKQSFNSPQNSKKSRGSQSGLRKRLVPSILSQIKSKQPLISQVSVADKQLKEIIQNLHDHPIEEEIFNENQSSINARGKYIGRSRRFLRRLMEKPKFHYIIITLIIVDLIVVFVELILGILSMPCLTHEEMEEYNVSFHRETCILEPSHHLEIGELVLYYISLVIICIFVLEIFTAFYAFGWRRYLKVLFLLDAIIVLASFILEVYFHFGATMRAGRASASIVVLRLWKIIRAIHAIAHSISLRNLMIIKEIEKARTILQEEKLQVEKTVLKQQQIIDNFTYLMTESNTPSIQEKTNQIIRRRSYSVKPVTYF